MTGFSCRQVTLLRCCLMGDHAAQLMLALSELPLLADLTLFNDKARSQPQARLLLVSCTPNESATAEVEQLALPGRDSLSAGSRSYVSGFVANPMCSKTSLLASRV